MGFLPMDQNLKRAYTQDSVIPEMSMRGENAMSEKGNKSARPGRTESIREIEKVGGKHGVQIKIPDHPDHSEVHGDGGKGCPNTP
jgi:hypothetical protein